MTTINHIRCRWTSQRGVEFAEIDPQGKVYGTHPAREGWTDIRHFEVDLNDYMMDLIVKPNKTVPEIAQAVRAEIALNGPFAYITDDNATPIGYRVRNGILEQKETSVPQWIDFILGKDGKPRIAQLDPENVSDIALSFSATSELTRGGKSYVNVYGENTPVDVRDGDRPRTALGIKVDGKLLFVVVDGDADTDAGLTLPKLARVMLALGGDDSMNLDGGGSSCLVQNGAEISGNPGTRRLGAAICFWPKHTAINPFPEYRVTSPYGYRILNGQREFHTGIDLVKYDKAPIYSFTDGEVIFAGMGQTGTGLGGYGNVVAIRDRNGCLNVYAHLDDVLIRPGTQVERGKLIGRQGNTGRSFGSHLHYEVRKNSESGPPYGWIADRPNNCYEPTAYLQQYYAPAEPAQPARDPNDPVTWGEFLKFMKEKGLI